MFFSASEPAGGAAADQVVVATAMALVPTLLLTWLIVRHRCGRGRELARLAELGQRWSGLPAWCALPTGAASVALTTALLGMYWDISLHVDQGRDAGPLANPAHYLILAGLFGVFASGCLAMTLAVGERPGPAPLRLGRDWHAPVGGVLMALCGGYALIGFPLDDVWHRLFGQDVTLWGPTHLMLIGGAGMTLIGQAVLLAEGMWQRRRASARPERASAGWVVPARRMALMGGLLTGSSAFQAEFDFGVPQFDQVFQPVLIALAAGFALVAARVWAGRGGALAAALFFLAVRGTVSLLVGPVLGETTPALPLYLGEALCVELAGLLLARRRRPLALGAVAGLLCGTAGYAAEAAWSQLVMPLPWRAALLPEGILLAVVAGVAGGVLGGLLGAALRGTLPRPRVARAAFAGALAAIAVLVANGLATEEPHGVRATVQLSGVHASGPDRVATATVRIEPPGAARDARWLTALAWQGGGMVGEALHPVGDGTYRTTAPIPISGDWKTLIRLHRGRWIAAVPVFMPADAAIPAREIPASRAFTRPMADETPLLQRERKGDVPGWLWLAASLAVLALSLAFAAALAAGLGRVGRSVERRPQAGSAGSGRFRRRGAVTAHA